jgi:hypothetical protein
VLALKTDFGNNAGRVRPNRGANVLVAPKTTTRVSHRRRQSSTVIVYLVAPHRGISISTQPVKDAKLEVRQLVEREPAAEALLQRYNLAGIVERVQLVLFGEAGASKGVRRLMLSTDREWSEDRPRLVLTVEFDADLVQAYEAWKSLYPQIEPISGAAEDGETLIFDFVGRNA